MRDQMFTRTAGSTTNSMTTPRIAATRFRASAGFVMPSMSPKAVRTSAIIATDPARAIHPCMKFDPFMVPRSLP